MSNQLNDCENNITRAESRIDTKSTDTGLFAHDPVRRHNKERFHRDNSDCRLTILGRAFTQAGWTSLPSRQSLQTSSSQINIRQSFAASATVGRVVATIHEFQPIGGRRSVTFKHDVIRLKSTIFVPRAASLCSPGLARISTTPSAHNCCSRNNRASKWPTPRLVAIARPAVTSVSHTIFGVSPYSTVARRRVRPQQMITKINPSTRR